MRMIYDLTIPNCQTLTAKRASFPALFIFLLIQVVNGRDQARSHVSAAVGQQVQMQCHLNQSSTSAEWWYRESLQSLTMTAIVVNGNVTSSFRDRVARGNRGTIVVQILSKSDSGVYTCLKQPGLGQSLSIVLNVTAHVSVEVGSTMVLPCYSSTPDVDWKFQRSSDADQQYVYSNGVVYDSFKNKFNIFRPSAEEFNLKVVGVTERDSGYYSCHEDGGVHEKTHTVRVITYKVVKVGDNVTLPCWTKYNIAVKWWFTGKQTSTQQQLTIFSLGLIYDDFKERFSVNATSDGHYNLTISSVQSSDYGFYVCLEKNAMKDRHFVELRAPGNVNSVHSPTINVARTTTPSTPSNIVATDAVPNTVTTTTGLKDDCSLSTDGSRAEPLLPVMIVSLFVNCLLVVAIVLLCVQRRKRTGYNGCESDEICV